MPAQKIGRTIHFFTVEVVTWLGLVRYHVLFAIDIATRKVEILGAAVNPGGRVDGADREEPCRRGRWVLAGQTVHALNRSCVRQTLEGLRTQL